MKGKMESDASQNCQCCLNTHSICVPRCQGLLILPLLVIYDLTFYCKAKSYKKTSFSTWKIIKQHEQNLQISNQLEIFKLKETS